jgi:hypothetical protein
MGVQLNSVAVYRGQIDASPPAAFDAQPLSFDVLLQMLIQKLGALDKNIEDLACAGEKNAKVQGELNKLSSMYRDHVGGINDKATCDAIDAQYQAAISAAGKDTPIGQRLQSELDSFRQTSNDNNLDAGEVGSRADNVKDMVTDLGTANQQDLFSLQNAAQERTQFIQSISNLLQSMNQATATTVNNIK